MPIYFAHLLGMLRLRWWYSGQCTSVPTDVQLCTAQVYTSVDHWMSNRKLQDYKPINKSVSSVAASFVAACFDVRSFTHQINSIARNINYFAFHLFRFVD